MRLKLRKRNNDLMVILPRELICRLDWDAGDFVDATIVDGNLVMLGAETMHARVMKIARRGMQKYRKALEDLSKS